jgi:signal transduction histidine kinase
MAGQRRVSLKQRFLLFLMLVFLTLFSIVATLLIVRKSDSERANLNEQAKSFATLATKPVGDAFLLYKDSGSIRIKQQVDKFTELDPDITAVSIVSTSGGVVFQSGAAPRITTEQAETFDPIYISSRGTIKQAIVPLIEDFGVHRYSIVYEVSDSRIRQDLGRTIASVILLSIVLFAIALALTYKFIDVFFLSPVSIISRRALTISQGDLQGQIESKRRDELGDLALAVNTMANSLRADIVKLQEADKLKTEFITISSHNLRTPLTSIKGNIELLQDAGVPDHLQQMVQALAASSSRLSNYIEDLLAISTVESGEITKTTLHPQPIKPLLEEVAEAYTDTAEQKQLEFVRDFDVADKAVEMNQHLLRIAFVNLLENAFKFTKQGSVHFEARPEVDGVIIKVIDTGIGITEGEKPKLFTKFHRGTSVMQYDYEGSGIGLYLTKLIIDLHKGKIKVDSQEGQGTTVTVELPALLQ